MIHEVYEEGAAARDGRLWAGDQILEVCMCGFYVIPVDMVPSLILICEVNLSLLCLINYSLTYFSPT